jgi:uncharacterized protein (DUF1684 family)
MDHVTNFREQIDDFMQNHPQSPLDPQQRKAFEGLDYFDDDEDFVFEVDVTRLSDDEPELSIPTSTGDTQIYRRWGTFAFEVDGQKAELTILSDPGGTDFFMPFKDTTNGTETYGAGRYLDNHRPGLRRLGATRFEIDFNFAYNPYCAYSPYFSCPLPPVENWLKLPIRAGEKNFSLH